MKPRASLLPGSAALIAIVVASCSHAPASTATGPPSTAGVVPTAAPTPSSLAIADREPWIVFQALFAADNLGLIRPDGTHSQELPGSPGNRRHPDWSPDGMWLTYDYDLPTSREIWVTRVDGTGSRLVVPCDEGCDGSELPAWTPDGAAIGFDSGDKPTPEHPGGVCWLGMVDVASGETRRIHEIPDCEGGGEDGRLTWTLAIRFNPDASQFVVQGMSAENRSALFIGATTGGRERQLTEWGLGARPDWSPDGEWIVFMSSDPDNGGRTPVALHRIRPDGSGLEQLTQPTDGAADLYPRYLHDGSGILYSHCPGPGWPSPTCEARRMSADGSTSVALFTPPGYNPVHVIWRPGTPTK